MTTQLQSMTYHQRKLILWLGTFDTRMLREDRIRVYKILTNTDRFNLDKFLSLLQMTEEVTNSSCINVLSLLRDITEGRMLGKATRERKRLQMLSDVTSKYVTNKTYEDLKREAGDRSG